MYDIFAVSQGTYDKDLWKSVKEIYPTAVLHENVKDFSDIAKSSFTKMFWVIWDDVILNQSFDLNSYQATKWDDSYIHVFKNDKFYDGICLFPKSTSVTQEEFDTRLFENKKEIDIDASVHKKYDVFEIDTYEDYVNAIEHADTELFWCVWPEIQITDQSIFNLVFSKHNFYDRKENHGFKHLLNKDEIVYNGVYLLSKHKQISKKEIQYRFLINKKEHDRIVSTHKSYDVVFISYQEPNADENYARLKEKFPRAKRVHGVKGIHQAHVKAAEISTTDMIWVVDGDAIIMDSFKFEYNVTSEDKETVHVWRSVNPVNDLVYGYGGVKLLPRKMTLNMDVTRTDMTTSISKRFKPIKEISNVTAFNTDPFNTWKSAFRECAKLASKTIDRQKEDETNERLNAWCSRGKSKPFGEYAIRGASDGMEFGLSCSTDELKLINDFNWLLDRFNNG